ncbi:uncharacterized protein LOC135476280 isoform X2 [Liolophura sinensis]|uniref:uncharacterized protein LOC135476280 isoform X2 n=1 Tax=Liolophura sinensis TaxID=3198878 RepID=UPI0031581327
MATSMGGEDIEAVALINNISDETHNPKDDDVIIEIPDENGGLRPTNVNQILPEGKDYHLFFAYSSDDSAFVRQRVKSLESPPYNLKCCFSDRDFLPGKPIHENIEWLMPRCMKIVLVLSPSFYESGWCQMEERLAHAFSATSGLGVIPLVHKPCQIPDTLKTLNYIDETRAEEADNKLLEAVFAPAGPSNVLPNWFNPRKDVNGCGVWLPATEASPCGYNWIFPDITQADINVLRDIGANIAVVYYNTQRCKDFIKELLKNNRGGERMDQVNDEELDARADAIVDNLVDKLASKFARWEEIQAANFLRHKTKQDKLCLCQLYEASSEHSF